MTQFDDTHRVGSVMPWQLACLRQALAMPSHALLLHGPSGLGQYEIAFAIATAWLCESQERAEHDPACGVCASCRQLEGKAHTDLVVLMPEALMLELGWPLSEKAQKELDEKKRKPSQEIRIEAVRDAIAFSELSSGRGRAKVVLVYPAHAMNSISANALLKTLEEPSASLRFILATESVQDLLPTVRSRCQALALSAPTIEQSVEWLESVLPQTPPAERETALRASGGRPIEALKMATSGCVADWTGFPNAILKGDTQALSYMTTSQLLMAMQKLCHDLWAVKLGEPPRFFNARDLPKAPPARALAEWGEQLKQQARVVDHPFRAELFVEDLVQRAKVCINSRS